MTSYEFNSCLSAIERGKTLTHLGQAKACWALTCWQADTGVVPFLVMLELLSRSDKKLSELLAPFFARYFLTGEINTPVADVPLKLQELKERYAALGGGVSHLGRLPLGFDDWHFNVRPSNTEPLLRLNLEALSQAEMEARRDEVLALIRS